jgi:RNA polymerase-binding transcription factor DksA
MSRSTLPRQPETLRSPATVVPAEMLAGLREMLEQQREFRLDQLAQLHLPGPHGPLSSTDPEILRSLVSGARAALRDVRSALWRMDEGRYGECVRCADPVEIERLEILPQTALCLTCQRAATR